MVRLGATEAWTFTDTMTFGHSFHLRAVQLRIASRPTGPLPAREQGRKDAVFIPRDTSVTCVARFADFASATDPFRHHGHMSNHEDEGLMGHLLVP
jgi:FtsP/CotA-like multicopper oxidase with cupredoxin domain